MDIDSLTIGDAKKLAAMFSNAQPAPEQEGEERAVLVTTAHRGVFFGYAKAVGGDTIKLRNARNCVYWSADVKGFVGLASTGPTASCRVGPRADLELRNITCVATCSHEAVKAWEAAPWKS